MAGKQESRCLTSAMFTEAQSHTWTQARSQTHTRRQFSAEARQSSQQHCYYPADASTREKLQSKHIFGDDHDSAAVQGRSASHVKVPHPPLHPPFSPFVWFPLVVEMDGVVVATRNTSRTIVPAEDKNKQKQVED